MSRSVPGNRLRGLYAITDPQLTPGETLLPAVEQAILGGARLLQYRNKSASPAQRRREASALLELCRRHQVPLLVNDDVSLCQEIGADGVHLGQQDGALSHARQILGPDAIIGISCHNQLDHALRARDGGANYVAMGRFFASRTKPTAPSAEIADLRQVRSRLELPIVAIGGVNAENGASLIEAGADMLAVIHHLFAAEDIRARAAAIQKLFQR